MTTATKPTGSASVMKIEDNGEYIDFWLLGVNQRVEQIPWASTFDGVRSSWQAFTLLPNVSWQKVTTIRVTTPQTITFSLGASGNPAVGGPTDFDFEVERAAQVVEGTGVVRIHNGSFYVTAIPYVKDNGVWKQAQPWGRLQGEWNPAT